MRASVVLATALGAASLGIIPGARPLWPAEQPQARRIVVLVSANAEWKEVRARISSGDSGRTPYGEYLLPGGPLAGVVVFHGGWGKISAAGGTQYAIDRWKPDLLINIGTCGGFRGAINRGAIVLVEKTIVYDIIEQMGDPQEAIRDYSTVLDTAWAGADLPAGVTRHLLISGDRDIVASEIPTLQKTYGAVAADWESGAIAYVAHANAVPALILRGVSDLVGEAGGEAYGNEAVFEEGTGLVMGKLLDQLPFWIGRWQRSRR